LVLFFVREESQSDDLEMFLLGTGDTVTGLALKATKLPLTYHLKVLVGHGWPSKYHLRDTFFG
jgi:hypothetical protein